MLNSSSGGPMRISVGRLVAPMTCEEFEAWMRYFFSEEGLRFRQRFFEDEERNYRE